MVAHPAPAALERIAAAFDRLDSPHRFGAAGQRAFGGIEPVRGSCRSAVASCRIECGIEGADQRQRLDQPMIERAGDVTHQRAEPSAMLDQAAQIVTRPCAARRFEHQRVDPGIDEVIFERGVILQIHLAAPLCDFVERRLGDVEMAILDDLGHLAVEEGEQQRADMRAVDVGVGHDHDLVIAQLFDVEFVADPGAERLNQRADFLRRNDAVEARPFDVQNLALQRQDRLHMPVAALLGAAAGGVPFDQEELALAGVAFLAIGKLAGQAGDVHRALAPGQFARLLCRLARRSGIDDLLDHGFRMRRIFLKPFGHAVGH